MAGIYLHIPFCKKRCHYCDFFKTTDFSAKVSFLSALQKELEQRKNELAQELVHTIYLGGGTPSVLSADELHSIFQCIRQYYTIAPDAEITMECNPDDLSPEYLQMISQEGINRLSMGIQSFADTDLQIMNRRHKAQQATDAVSAAHNAGLSNISIDLIYGLPGQDLSAWESNIDKAISLNVPHISAYHLTYHEGTIFYERLKTGSLKELPDELSLQQFQLLKTKLEKAGYEHYEISNFALPGYYSRHNSAYWKQEKYLGIGPSAHSFDLRTRRWNIASVGKYINNIASGEPYFEEEILTDYDRYNDYIITRLRTIWGVSESDIHQQFPETFIPHFKHTIHKYIQSGHIIEKEQTYILTTTGLFISDAIMEDLMLLPPS